MSSVHKRSPIPFRPPADSDDREWLEAHAEQTGRAVNAVLAQALREYREKTDGARMRQQRA